MPCFRALGSAPLQLADFHQIYPYTREFRDYFRNAGHEHLAFIYVLMRKLAALQRLLRHNNQ